MSCRICFEIQETLLVVLESFHDWCLLQGVCDELELVCSFRDGPSEFEARVVRFRLRTPVSERRHFFAEKKNGRETAPLRVFGLWLSRGRILGEGPELSSVRQAKLSEEKQVAPDSLNLVS